LLRPALLASPFLASPLAPAASTASAPAPPSASLAARLGRVDPAFLEVTERDHDFGPRRARPQEIDDLGAQNRRGIARQRRDALGVEEHHPCPGDFFCLAGRAAEVHDKKIALMVERVVGILEVRQGLAAEILEEREMFLAPFQGLLHRDHAVPEHAGLRHGGSCFLFVFRPSRSPGRCRGKSRGR
jgi:hypothetical protein